MSTAAPPLAAERPGRAPGRLAAIIAGALVALVGFALLLGGAGVLFAYGTQRDDDGFFTTPTERFAADGYALTHEGVELNWQAGPDAWTPDDVGTVRLSASGSDVPLFVGIGPAEAVDDYLAGVEHAVIDEVRYAPFRADYGPVPGDAPAAQPAEQGFWVAQATGSGRLDVDWTLEEGTWSAVVMNADASRGVAADLEFGARSGWVPWIGAGLLAAAVVLLAAGGFLLFYGARTPGGGGAAALPAAGGGAATVGTYPVRVEGDLDEPLSRWLWLVKWLLAIPHWIVLAFLWVALVVLTVVAFFAILATGRYPRGIFDFNLGVLRWTWRVGFYATQAIGTDRYPPFSLGPEPGYPARLDVPYPERLSRGLVLVKSWLLLLPHWIVVAIFTGTWLGWTWGDGEARAPSLVTILVVIAGVVLLFRGRYPRDLFRLLVGINRWVFRVIAYAALMRDEYPPFRLDP